ncbi:MotA/TolQ/ExbB proton channel family protein [Flammeovirga yaeyamensis]|uniref:MotA/TolQ/ExbB proton channel family protein n=1 Tax=Flammeovirga yaeyamensis TaxID=367791 RepID=A0AAX1N9H3_9BACT|nr:MULTISPECIES: MotA/TolQ/ExbB proton channel family protein [Flammeovirga]ANQ49424.1 MotA/TolQ/ExbB proton channel family protein [Flammeovirga sp. MY04]MBB3697689.1 biopolymer transport protein ExbB [Flammeovirga yaeyamensis]NMF35951.1 MotA/TolQ/ExbB proton channel family protein [Flammeovirga yaeyamensis]QWG03101.1 MotA/TolQ/ExbB proton channel family protein [Flammeovirga yaeyamensis]
MKKVFALLMFFCALTFNTAQLFAQDEAATEEAATETEEVAAVEEVSAVTEVSSDDVEGVAEEATYTQAVKQKFIEGGWEFMGAVLITLILGLAIAIERVITLTLSTTNTKKLMAKVDEALSSGGVDSALEVTKATRGPVASIFTQGLMRASEGVDMVEKSVVAYGSVEMGKLERGLPWISLFIALAPMLGFMGTVIGMIGAFDAIEAAGDISPSLVAGGIKVALLTTVAGLIVGVILQIFYNYCVSTIDGIVLDMEDASVSLIDMLVKHEVAAK